MKGLLQKVPLVQKYAKVTSVEGGENGVEAGESGKTDIEAQVERRMQLAKKVNISQLKRKSVVIKAPKKYVSDDKKNTGKELDLNELLKNKILSPEEQEKLLKEEELRKQKQEEEALLELNHPELFIDWHCLVCKTFNHARKEIQDQNVDVIFGLKGLQYKTTFAQLLWESKSAKCTKCFTAYDYVPPEATAHLFPHNSKPFVAFHDYPPLPRLQHGLPRDETSVLMNKIKSCWWGLMGNVTSKLMKNDWKLKKYITDQFPPLFRYTLGPGELYEVGEIVECKQQKLEFCRAKIIDTHPGNNTYDIKYDFGDELRFVPFSKIRPRPEKRSFAYRIELAMILNVVYFPMGIVFALKTMNYGLFFLMFFLTALMLFLVKLVTFVQYCYNFYEAGIWVILRLTLFYTLPIFFLMVFSAIGLSQANELSNWSGITGMLVVTLIFALPVIYAIRASYVVIAGLIFLQVMVGLILLSDYASHYYDPLVVVTNHLNQDGTTTTHTYVFHPSFGTSLLVPLIPIFTLLITFKYLRRHLKEIWDVCFVIRPLIDTVKHNPSIIKIVWEKMKLFWYTRCG
jgi:hypothetical protein